VRRSGAGNRLWMTDNCVGNQSERGGFSAFIFCLFFCRRLSFGVVRFAKVAFIL